jgi:hypothetical protein
MGILVLNIEDYAGPGFMHDLPVPYPLFWIAYMTGEQSVVVTGVSTGIGWGITKVLDATN